MKIQRIRCTLVDVARLSCTRDTPCLPWHVCHGENCLSRSIKPQHGQNRCKRVPVSLLNAFSNPCMRLRNGFSFICPVRGTRGRGARANQLVLQVNPLSWFKSKRTTSSKRIHFKHVSVRNMIAERCVETGGRMSHGVETRIIKYRFTVQTLKIISILPERVGALANYNAIADNRLRALNDAFEAIVRCGPKGIALIAVETRASRSVVMMTKF